MATFHLSEGYKLSLNYSPKGKLSDEKTRLRYSFSHEGKTIFRGDDYLISRSYKPFSKETAASLLMFLTLQEYDTDEEYFESYTPEQLEWRDANAERLSMLFADDLGLDQI